MRISDWSSDVCSSDLSESPIGGLVQVSTFVRNQKVVEYIVADAGLGIPATLRSGRPEIGTDTDALDRAIREGVTRDKSIGQGRSEEHTSELQSLMRISYAVFCLKKKTQEKNNPKH